MIRIGNSNTRIAFARRPVHRPVRVAIALLLLAALGNAVFVSSASAESVPIYARNGMVVTVDPIASEVGIEILKQGGNAFDAAAAVGFALAVTHPRAGNLGGGGFCVGLEATGDALAPSASFTPFALDFREVAPLAAGRDMYLDDEGNVVTGLSLFSHLAVGVPGTVDGLLRLHADRGQLTRAEILVPAIKLARNGFTVSYSLSEGLESQRARLSKFPGTAAVFYPDGETIKFGSTLIQSDLAQTLERIAQHGADGFYKGTTADLVVAEMKRGGGIITLEDLATYESKYREPFAFDYGEYHLITHPLPSSGGITLAQILGIARPMLEDARAKETFRTHGPINVGYIFCLTEAERLAYADRNYFLGDSDFVNVPVESLVAQSYLAERRKLIPETYPDPRTHPIPHGNPESEETTHYCVADKDGNVAAITYTLNGPFGMGAVVQGAGFILNNEMDDFSAKPGVPNLYGLVGAEANAIEPGKRMLSSMTPTIVLKDGEFYMTIGSPGGSTIITTVLQVFLNMTYFNMNIRDAIDTPRFHHQWLPNVVYYESGAVSLMAVDTFLKGGSEFKLRANIGMAAGIARTEDGFYAGHADRRGPGVAVGY